jgi:hypothetical protein
MSVDEQLQHCAAILGEVTSDPDANQLVLQQCRLKVRVLSDAVKNLCVKAKGPQSPSVSFEIAHGLCAVLGGIDTVNRALKHTELGAGQDSLKELAEDRRGVLKNIIADVNAGVHTTEAIDWIATPVLRHIVAVLREIDAAISGA